MKIQKNTLYLVGTPIGNLSDLSDRAAQVLREVDFIAAEDTRNALKLLNYLEVKKPLVSYYQHNKRQRGEIIADRIEKGESCALITDAGMPAISDPGEDLCALCHERGITLSPIPGPCAAICALACSGLPSGKFSFEGFLSTSGKSRRKHLAEAALLHNTMIFYEAPHKLRKTLSDMATAFGDRRIALCRELTKIYEEIELTTLYNAQKKYENITPKGEFVLVIEGAPPEADSPPVSDSQSIAFLKELMDNGLSKKEAIQEAATKTGKSRNDLYALLLGLPKKEKGFSK